MSDFDKLIYCPKCKKETWHCCSGSGRKKTCLECGRRVVEIDDECYVERVIDPMSPYGDEGDR